MNGSSQYSGRVEFFNRNDHHINSYGSNMYNYFALQWGTICDNYWNETDASESVVCRSLGYRTISAIPHVGGTFGAGSGLIVARDVTCAGTELYIVDCDSDRSFLYSSYSEPPCDHTEDVGVTCLGNAMNYACILRFTATYVHI